MTAAWPMVSLGEICEIQRGGSPRPISSYITESEDGINWIKIGDVAVGAKYLSSTEEKIKPEGAKRSRMVYPGDFILSNSMSFGRPYIMRTSGCIHDGWLVLRDTKKRLSEDYLYHVLGSDFVVSQFKKMAVGAVVKNLNKEVVQAVVIPLPPLPEQRRIAAILDQADALRAKRREALAQLDSLTQSIFIEMFGDISVGPKFNLGSIRAFADANSGKSAKSVLSDEKTGIPIYGGNGINGWAHTALYDHPVLIFGRVGQQCGNAFITEGPSWVTDNAIVVRISDVTKLNPLFVLHAFQGSSFSNRVKHLDLPFINQGMILDNPIPIPPLIVQQTFANRIQTLEALKVCHRTSFTELDALFASLQHRAFRGEL